MKKILLFAFISMLSINAFAQFPDAGSKGFAFGLYGLQGINLTASHTGTLLYKYCLKDNFIMRYSVQLTLNNSDNSSTGGGRVYENESQSYSIGLGIGCEKILAKINKFEIYGGIDLVPGFNSSTSTSTQTVVDQTQAGGLNGDFSKTVNKTNPYTTISLFPFLGFEYFISKNFSIGAEFNINLAYSLPEKATYSNTSRSNGIDRTEVKSTTDQKAAFNISSMDGAAITTSVYF